ncbi:SRPBCC domain-containing protein [Steroidobacter cummioxidans]|uniref:SRPBCC domain-containing protein n=1 Tax=Steroidobacter cummioxidans TaxID=1803913 RepID=UPI000E312728|nr:SRPBCC domain-containing protein [Steroidobacter cummioxidans]
MSNERRLVSRIVIDGSLEAIWRELTKQDEPQLAVFNTWLHAQTLRPGARMQMRTSSQKKVMVVGEVLDYDPPRRFSHSFRFAGYDDPPCVVTYELKPVTGGVEVTLLVDNIPMGTPTAKGIAGGMPVILQRLKAIVETGQPALSTRLLYAAFAKLEFTLPRKCDVANWPI